MNKFLIPIIMILATSACDAPTPETLAEAKKVNDAQFVVERCVSGYKFAQDRWGNARPIQVLDENGKGIRCE